MGFLRLNSVKGVDAERLDSCRGLFDMRGEWVDEKLRVMTADLKR